MAAFCAVRDGAVGIVTERSDLRTRQELDIFLLLQTDQADSGSHPASFFMDVTVLSRG
jgi:hypothetical protein